jgi:hypothetical protein
MARLLVKSNGVGSQVIELKLGVNRLGRSSENDFQIEHSTVSAHHCEIELGSRGLFVRDCNSTNGTFVAGAPIKEAKLEEGQLLCMGDVELLVETTEVKIAIPDYVPPSEAPAPPVVLSDGSLVCPRHPHARVTYQCTHCKEVMCDVCVHRLRRRGGKLLELCPRCSGPCEPLLVQKKKKKRKLMQFLTTTVKLPFIHTTKDEE